MYIINMYMYMYMHDQFLITQLMYKIIKFSYRRRIVGNAYMYMNCAYIPGHKRRQKKFVRSFKPVPSKAKFCIRKLITIN